MGKYKSESAIGWYELYKENINNYLSNKKYDK